MGLNVAASIDTVCAMDALRTPDDRFADLGDFPYAPHYVDLVDGMRLPDPASLLNEMNPVNVETVQLISPSDAALRYGNQGANGVLLITTRRGR